MMSLTRNFTGGARWRMVMYARRNRICQILTERPVPGYGDPDVSWQQPLFFGRLSPENIGTFSYGKFFHNIMIDPWKFTVYVKKEQLSPCLSLFLKNPG